MREIRKSGLTRGSNGIGESRPLLSTLLVKIFISFKTKPGSQPVARVFQESTADRMSAAWQCSE